MPSENDGSDVAVSNMGSYLRENEHLYGPTED